MPEPAVAPDVDGAKEVPMSLRMKTWGLINPQSASPLFNGRLPAEIRTFIFKLAFTESTAPGSGGPQHDFCIRYDHDVSDDDEDDADVDDCSSEESVDTPDIPLYSDMYSSFHSQSTLDDINLKEYGETDNHYETVDTGTRIEKGTAGDRSSDGAASELENDERAETDDCVFWTGEGDSQVDWIRPDFQCVKRIHTDLLRTCRRIYLETRHLPAQAGLTFWMEPLPYENESFGQVERYLEGQIPVGAALGIRSVHLHVPLWWLEFQFRSIVEDSAKQIYSRPPGYVRLLDRVEDLRLTMRKRDWPDHGRGLYINPFVNDPEERRNMQAAIRAGVPQHAEDRSWSLAFLSMPRLKKLTIDFEAPGYRKAEMDTIVQWAKTWRFPVLRDWSLPAYTHLKSKLCPESLRGVRHAYLSAVETPIRKTSWRGYSYHWDSTCPRCEDMRFRNRHCKTCRSTTRLMKERKGPRLFVWTLTWTAEPDFEPDPGSREVAEIAVHLPPWAKQIQPRLDSDQASWEDHCTNLVYF